MVNVCTSLSVIYTTSYKRLVPDKFFFFSLTVYVPLFFFLSYPLFRALPWTRAFKRGDNSWPSKSILSFFSLTTTHSCHVDNLHWKKGERSFSNIKICLLTRLKNLSIDKSFHPYFSFWCKFIQKLIRFVKENLICHIWEIFF